MTRFDEYVTFNGEIIISSIWRCCTISPDEVIEKLEQLNIKITRRTLLNYEKQGFIAIEATRGGKGRGRGRTTEYANRTWIDAYIAYRLIHDEKIPLKNVIIAMQSLNQAVSSDADLDKVNDTSLMQNDSSHTIIDIGLLYTVYFHAAIAHVPHGGRVIYLRENNLNKDIDEFTAEIEPKKYDAIVVMGNNSKKNPPIVLMWDNEKWEKRPYKL